MERYLIDRVDCRISLMIERYLIERVDCCRIFLTIEGYLIDRVDKKIHGLCKWNESRVVVLDPKERSYEMCNDGWTFATNHLPWQLRRLCPRQWIWKRISMRPAIGLLTGKWKPCEISSDSIINGADRLKGGNYYQWSLISKNWQKSREARQSREKFAAFDFQIHMMAQMRLEEADDFYREYPSSKLIA